MADASQTVRLIQVQDFQFDVDFGTPGPALRADEPARLGQGVGPSPVQLLAAAVDNCLSASLSFALRKFKQVPEPPACTVRAEVGRNAKGRMRVPGLTATLTLGVPAKDIEHLDRVLGGFESCCTVTQSVSPAIPVAVEVFDAAGIQLK